MADPRRDTEHRPSPEALLEAARREERRIGKLRIFVGAAPGVGKTYEMLQQAQARKKDGYDVVIGIVETHGRKETEALLSGLETIPRRQIEYKGQLLSKWIWTRSLRVIRKSYWSTSSPTPTLKVAAIPSAILMPKS
jgi:two-component system sensor histidine kinase KdpD